MKGIAIVGRTTFKITYSNYETAEKKITEILYTNKFRQTIVNGETIWKKGGTLMGGQCIAFQFSKDHMIVSAWLTPFLDGESEHDLEEISGIIPKRQLLSVIEQIKIAVK